MSVKTFTTLHFLLYFWSNKWSLDKTFQKYFKVPLLCLFEYYVFHAVCHVAVCEHNLSEKLWSRQFTINKIIVL